MAWVATAVVGTGLVSSYMGSQAAGRAADAQTNAANNSNAVQLQMYNQNRADNEPYRQSGVSALDRLNGRDGNFTARQDLQKQLEEAQKNSGNLANYLTSGKDINGQGSLERNGSEWTAGKKAQDDLIAKYQTQLSAMGPASQALTPQETGQQIMSQDPGYQFRLDQGNKSINAASAARGNSMGGATMKALTRYGSDYASNEYGNAYNRLAAMAGVGQTANSSNGQAGMNYGNQYGQNQSNIGNAQAAGQIGQANAATGAISNGVNSWMQYNMMNRMFPNSGS